MADLPHIVIQGLGFLLPYCLINQDSAFVLLGKISCSISKIPSEEREKSREECVLAILGLAPEWHTTLLFKRADLSHKAVDSCNELGKSQLVRV